MKKIKTSLLWVFALFITLASAHYQRMTGPTYPISGTLEWGGGKIKYSLERSHGGSDNHKIRVQVPTGVTGVLDWKRYKTADPWTSVPMVLQNDFLAADLPGQPPAGKLEYKVLLSKGSDSIVLPPNGMNAPVIRFKGVVPLGVLVPHIVFMFAAMLFCARTGIEIFRGDPKLLKRLSLWTFGALTLGGMVLGPIVQKYAFGAYWTGWPYGTDLTDNKTLIAFVGWVIGIFALYRLKKPKFWVLGAVAIMFAVYLIPHSMRGSELDYNKLDATRRPVLSQPQAPSQ